MASLGSKAGEVSAPLGGGQPALCEAAVGSSASPAGARQGSTRTKHFLRESSLLLIFNHIPNMLRCNNLFLRPIIKQKKNLTQS